MQIEQLKWSEASGWNPAPAGNHSAAQLVLAFGSPEAIRSAALIADIQRAYPQSIIAGCSTAGEIVGASVTENSFVVTAIRFEKTAIKTASINLTQHPDSLEAGKKLAEAFPAEMQAGDSAAAKPLKHVLLFADGLDLNGSELTAGLTQSLPRGVTVTGGLAGDGLQFKETLVFRDNLPAKHTITAVGLYSNHLKIGFGSRGGWDPFGPERLVTKSHKNILYELDGAPALSLYKQYLGDYAKDLPASGLFFPLCIRQSEDEDFLVRTFLAFDEERHCMTFSGNIPQGSIVRMSKSNSSRLVEGAAAAADKSRLSGGTPAELAILISCVARKLVLKQRTEEEVEAVRASLGLHPVLTGFYSYGEIAPFVAGGRCELHNQTMTITTLAETSDD